MPKTSSSKSLSTVGLSGNLLYPMGQHPDGLRRARQFNIAPRGSHARCTAKGLCNPRWGLDYVITTIGQSWEMVTENENYKQERHFLQVLNGLVSMPKIR
jgi:hypothetical protein